MVPIDLQTKKVILYLKLEKFDDIRKAKKHQKKICSLSKIYFLNSLVSFLLWHGGTLKRFLLPWWLFNITSRQNLKFSVVGRTSTPYL